MKKKILIVLLFIVGVFSCFAFNILSNKMQTEDIIDESIEKKEIKMPDRIIFKYESKYYEITSEYEKYEELVDVCKEGMNGLEEYDISEQEIDSIKSETEFIEFDYNTISKNNIFLLSSEIGAIQMKESNGTVISKKLSNKEKIETMFLDAINGKEGYNFKSDLNRAIENYSYLPATLDFKEIKYDKVYIKEFENYSEYENLISRYDLKFNNNIEKEIFYKNKVLLFLSKYDINTYKINIGNIKINFSGTDYLVENSNSNEYIPILMVVSKIVNTNCIYYNYDNVKIEDNLTGTSEEIKGVIINKDENEFEISYTKDDNFKLGKVTISTEKITNPNIKVNDIEVGDFIQGFATVSSIENGIKSYEATSISITKSEEYNNLLENTIKGKSSLSTSIVEYYQSESNYDGYVICGIFLGENSYNPDAYIKVYYDFYEGNTESYLGRRENPVESNYGIVPYEIVDITFTDSVSNIDNIQAKVFEYIAD